MLYIFYNWKEINLFDRKLSLLTVNYPSWQEIILLYRKLTFLSKNVTKYGTSAKDFV